MKKMTMSPFYRDIVLGEGEMSVEGEEESEEEVENFSTKKN